MQAPTELFASVREKLSIDESRLYLYEAAERMSN